MCLGIRILAVQLGLQGATQMCEISASAGMRDPKVLHVPAEHRLQ